MSNLYMTTEEFAEIIIDTLHEQNYFKKGKKSHPADIVIAFVSTAETIASTVDWAIQREHQVRVGQYKETPVTYSKNSVTSDGYL